MLTGTGSLSPARHAITPRRQHIPSRRQHITAPAHYHGRSGTTLPLWSHQTPTRLVCQALARCFLDLVFTSCTCFEQTSVHPPPSGSRPGSSAMRYLTSDGDGRQSDSSPGDTSNSNSGDNMKRKTSSVTRRSLIQTGTRLALGGTLGADAVSEASEHLKEADPYKALGVRHVINATGTVTILGGSLMP